MAITRRRLRQERDRLVELRQLGNLGDRFDAVDRLRRDRHRADRLLVTLVADVDDAEALACPHLHLVVHLRDEWAHAVHDVAAPRAGGRHDLGRRSVGGEHDRAAFRHVGDVIDEHDPERLEPVDHELVVDDFVVAVDGRLEGAHHPRERLDRHLYPGAEPARRGEQHEVDLGCAGARYGGSDRCRRVFAHGPEATGEGRR